MRLLGGANAAGRKATEGRGDAGPDGGNIQGVQRLYTKGGGGSGGEWGGNGATNDVDSGAPLGGRGGGCGLPHKGRPAASKGMTRGGGGGVKRGVRSYCGGTRETRFLYSPETNVGDST